MNMVIVGGGTRGGSRRSRCGRAFSLVEVVLALGIVSFALLVMLALLPVGIEQTKDSLAETGAINVLSGLIADRKAMDYRTNSVLYSIPLLTNTMSFTSNTFGVTSANTNSTAYNQSLYRVTYEITPPQSGTLNPYLIYFKVSWPAGAPSTVAAGYVESTVAFPQP